MNQRRVFLRSIIGMTTGAILAGYAWAAPPAQALKMQKRWLFFWGDMSDLKFVDSVIAQFPRAQADGYNAVVFGHNLLPAKAAEFKQAAQQHDLGLVAMVMGGSSDRNYMEGLPVRDALFVAQGGTATLRQDNPTQVINGDFENIDAAHPDHFVGWGFQDSEGETSFADHAVVHSGKTSIRMENAEKNPGNHIRIEQPLKLQPYRQYHLTVWVKTQDSKMSPQVQLLLPNADTGLIYQDVEIGHTQDWTRQDMVFNSLEYDTANLYLGTWDGTGGTLWWDDLEIEEIGLMNLLRRPGCPVTVQGEDGTPYAEGQDYAEIVDTGLRPYAPYHDPPVIHLTPGSRIKDGQRLRVSYYHSILMGGDRVDSCLSEPKIFTDWASEVKAANDLYHPDAFFMQHDEIRVMNWCGSCQALHMTPGELLAWNVHKSAGIIRTIRPDAGIWVWSDMFDPMHNAVAQYYLVNGSLLGSWKGLDKDVGLINWNGGKMGKNCPFFADLGLRQILSGYYDSDNDGSAIAQWEANVADVEGVVGAMYTTWENNYAPMDVWAKKAWGA
jgi:hypothetical protein